MQQSKLPRMQGKYHNPILRECEDESHTPEMGTWESFGTPESSEFDCKGQNTLHWGVLYIIGRLLKCRCRNGLAWPIWTSATQVMAKRKAGSQTGSLTSDHGKSGIDPIPLRAGGVQHVVGKLSTRATTLV
jgi:hypothetical protein